MQRPDQYEYLEVGHQGLVAVQLRLEKGTRIRLEKIILLQSLTKSPIQIESLTKSLTKSLTLKGDGNKYKMDFRTVTHTAWDSVLFYSIPFHSILILSPNPFQSNIVYIY